MTPYPHISYLHTMNHAPNPQQMPVSASRTWRPYTQQSQAAACASTSNGSEFYDKVSAEVAATTGLKPHQITVLAKSGRVSSLLEAATLAQAACRAMGSEQSKARLKAVCDEMALVREQSGNADHHPGVSTINAAASAYGLPTLSVTLRSRMANAALQTAFEAVNNYGADLEAYGEAQDRAEMPWHTEQAAALLGLDSLRALRPYSLWATRVQLADQRQAVAAYLETDPISEAAWGCETRHFPRRLREATFAEDRAFAALALKTLCI